MDLCTCHGFNVYDGTHLEDGYFWCEEHDPRAVYALPARREREGDLDDQPKRGKRVKTKTEWTPVLCEKLCALMRHNCGDMLGSGVQRAQALLDLWEQACMGAPQPSRSAIARHISSPKRAGGIHRCYQTAQAISQLYESTHE